MHFHFQFFLCCTFTTFCCQFYGHFFTGQYKNSHGSPYAEVVYIHTLAWLLSVSFVCDTYDIHPDLNMVYKVFVEICIWVWFTLYHFFTGTSSFKAHRQMNPLRWVTCTSWLDTKAATEIHSRTQTYKQCFHRHQHQMSAVKNVNCVSSDQWNEAKDH